MEFGPTLAGLPLCMGAARRPCTPPWRLRLRPKTSAGRRHPGRGFRKPEHGRANVSGDRKRRTGLTIWLRQADMPGGPWQPARRYDPAV